MIVFLCDLDDTLFSTKKKITVKDSLTLLSTLQDETPSGYATSRQMRLINLMLNGDPEHLFIPVTARSQDAYRRVNLNANLAVLAHGGLILREGKRDQAWAEQIANKAKSQASVQEIMADIISLDKSWRHWALTDGDTELYYIIKSETNDIQAAKDLAGGLRESIPHNITVQQNGNNIALVPNWLSKKSAVEYLLDQIRIETPDALAIGMGDSTSDLPFMLACDYAVFPGTSQVADNIKENIVK